MIDPYQMIDPYRTIDGSPLPAPSALIKIALPMNLTGEAQDLLLLPQANQDLQSRLHDLALCAEAGKALRLLQQSIVDLYIGAHLAEPLECV
jgi:hypothetical protein